MPVHFNGKPKGPVKFIHVDDLEETLQPHRDRPLPLDKRIKLDARIRAECVEIVAIDDLKPNSRNAKKHPDRQIALLRENFEQFGFTNPILVDENCNILAGHARYIAAKQAGFLHLPVIRHSHLSPAKKRAFAIADNKLAELGEWDLEILSEEISFLFDPQTELSFDPRVIGFETVEIDQILSDEPEDDRADPADDIAPLNSQEPAVTKLGDAWICDQHRLVCGDATSKDAYSAVMETDMAEIAFTDPPYNVPNAGHVTARDGVREFAMAHGEMTPNQFTDFLSIVFANILARMVDGAVGYLCMDWRHLLELRAAADPVFGALKNLIVWVKSNAGMGSFYRSQHELICVYAAPGRPINNFGLGGKGRHRTNVWKYPGFNSFGRGRDKALAMHPTVKPVAMVMDALMDCSNRGGIVLDPFGGSGTTMIAAERTSRRARLIEIDPLYCDVIVQRWQTYTGKIARLAETNETYNEVRDRRGAVRK
jgi:DNA modification methylase